jgi:hypothetical protein
MGLQLTMDRPSFWGWFLFLKVKTGSGLGPSSRMLGDSDFDFLLFFTLEQFTASG